MGEPQGTVSDLELIRLVQKGDTRAFDELMRRYNQAIYRLAYSLVRSHPDAEDICQETFVRAYRAIGRYDEHYRFYTWLHRICVNLCMNHFKRNRQQRTVPLPAGEAGAEWQDVPDPAGSPAEAELSRDLDRALTRLPPDQRAVFVLRVRDELSYSEIAHSLRIPVGTVMSRLNRARLKLRELLKDYLPS